jgi:hypothetical protein
VSGTWIENPTSMRGCRVGENVRSAGRNLEWIRLLVVSS